MTVSFDELYEIAKQLVNPRQISRSVEIASVAAALLTEAGNVYRGVCIDAPSALGMCAERAAIAEMLTNGETRIVKIVAVGEDGDVLAPCGVCRELINQIDDENFEAEVLLPSGDVATIADLLPEMWS